MNLEDLNLLICSQWRSNSFSLLFTSLSKSAKGSLSPYLLTLSELWMVFCWLTLEADAVLNNANVTKTTKTDEVKIAPVPPMSLQHSTVAMQVSLSTTQFDKGESAVIWWISLARLMKMQHKPLAGGQSLSFRDSCSCFYASAAIGPITPIWPLQWTTTQWNNVVINFLQHWGTWDGRRSCECDWNGETGGAGVRRTKNKLEVKNMFATKMRILKKKKHWSCID